LSAATNGRLGPRTALSRPRYVLKAIGPPICTPRPQGSDDPDIVKRNDVTSQVFVTVAS
jgi:hypothetical protein